MADIPTLEPAPKLAANSTAKPRKRSRLVPIIIAAVIVLGAGAAGAWFFLLHGGFKAKTAHLHAQAQPAGPALYVSLQPSFVTNFQPNQDARFLQVSIEVMTHEKKTVHIIKTNNPVIRNNLLLLLSNQKYATLETAQGKDQLRAKALKAVRKIVAANGGDSDSVDAVYFTSFVMQ